MEIIGNNLSQKIPKKYNCLFCDYYTSNLKDYVKHKTTCKHQKNENGNNLEINGNNFCNNCNKYFKTYSGLWKHNKKIHKKNVTMG